MKLWRRSAHEDVRVEEVVQATRAVLRLMDDLREATSLMITSGVDVQKQLDQLAASLRKGGGCDREF